jgi:NAD(P)-dependent dehydrogenase (short-subunit alcohol dehydrogenase family)
MRRAVITGGSRGIGLAIASELDRRGWGVFLIGQSAENLSEASSRLEHVLGSLSIDLGNGEAAARTASTSVTAVLDSVDLLVLNAGIFSDKPLTEISENAFRRIMAVNLDANLFMARGLLPVLRKGQRPRIVVIGSTAGYGGYPPGPAYSVTKWALRGLAANLRDELRADRIGVTYFAPGGTLTDMWDKDEAPPQRLLEPADTAILVAALTDLSEQAVVDEILLRPMLGDVL